MHGRRSSRGSQPQESEPAGTTGEAHARPLLLTAHLCVVVAARWRDLFDGAVEAAVPRLHRLHFFVGQQPLDVGDHVARVVVWHRGRPAGADAVSAVDEDRGDDGEVPVIGKRKRSRGGRKSVVGTMGTYLRFTRASEAGRGRGGGNKNKENANFDGVGTKDVHCTPCIRNVPVQIMHFATSKATGLKL
eukprot:354903-Chlamydomonas_euryale.AAC.29